MRTITRLALVAVLITAFVAGTGVSFGQSAHPYEAWSVSEPGAFRLSVDGDLLAVGFAENDYGGGWNGFGLYDLADPTAPAEVFTSADLGAQVWDVLLDGATLYVAADSLLVYDVSDPSAPVLIDSGTIGSPFTLALSGSGAVRGTLVRSGRVRRRERPGQPGRARHRRRSR